MKAVFPKNIQKGLLSGLNISIGPLSISIIQLFILAIGIAIAILIFLFFVLIAFFKVSELNIVAFLAKFIQNHFFDTTEKYQTNFAKTSQTDIAIEKFKIQNTKQKIDYKTKLELNNFDKIDTSGLLWK